MLQEFLDKIAHAKIDAELESIRVEALGKKGALSELMIKMRNASPSEKPAIGKEMNAIKNALQEALDQRKKYIEEEALQQSLKSSRLDITAPTRSHTLLGRRHIISSTIAEVYNICSLLGFKVIEGPEIETEWHNFDALNMGPEHPARQQHDTFYIRDSQNNQDISQDHSSNTSAKNISNNDRNPHKLLRTHTSSMQIRHMLQNPAPQHIASIGKVYRSDYDATHTPMFHQLEILSIDRSANMAQLKMCISTLLSMYFGISNIKMRFRSSYFPFTEPSMEIDIHVSKQDNRLIISKEDVADSSDSPESENGFWIEILGAGMVHKNVMRNMKVSDEFRGFAMGMGIERIAMLKHGISDLRYFYDNEYQGDSIL